MEVLQTILMVIGAITLLWLVVKCYYIALVGGKICKRVLMALGKIV